MARREFEIDDKQSEVYTGAGGKGTLSLPGGLDLYRPKPGTFRIDVIPFQVSSAVTKFAPNLRFSPPHKWHWNVMYRMHGGVGPDNATVVCASGTYGKPCPICEHRAALNRSAHKEDRELAKKLFPKERQLLLVSERDARSGDLGPVQLWEVSTFNFMKQLDVFLDAADREDEERLRRFWHPTKGLTLKLTGTEETTGNGKFTKFSVIEMKDRRQPLPDDIFDHGYELYSMVRERSYADVKAMFHGADPEEESPADPGVDADAFDAPNPLAAAAAAKRHAPPPESDEFPLDAGDDEPEAIAPPPKPAPRTPPAPPAKPQPKPAPAPAQNAALYVPEVGDIVSFESKDGKVEGTVIRVDTDRQIADVKTPKKERPFVVDWEELVFVSSSTEEPVDEPASPPPPPPAARPKPRQAPPPPPADDDDDLPPPPRTRR